MAHERANKDSVREEHTGAAYPESEVGGCSARRVANEVDNSSGGESIKREEIMKVGSVYTVDSGSEHLVIVGVVSKAPDENGYFSAWELHQGFGGKLYSFSNATRQLGDGTQIIELVPATDHENDNPTCDHEECHPKEEEHA